MTIIQTPAARILALGVPDNLKLFISDDNRLCYLTNPAAPWKRIDLPPGSPDNTSIPLVVTTNEALVNMLLNDFNLQRQQDNLELFYVVKVNYEFDTNELVRRDEAIVVDMYNYIRQV